MKSIRCSLSVLVISVLSQSAFAPAYSQEQQQNKTAVHTQTSSAPEATATSRQPLTFGLAQDTPVRLKLSRTMSSHDAKVDEKVAFDVVEDVKVGDVIVIQRGGTATATVTDAKPKGLTHSGKLDMNIEYVQLVSGDKVPLRATKMAKGDNQNAAVKGAMIATSVLFFPTPMLLSKDITIQQGTEITAYVAADTPLDVAKFRNPASGANSAAAVTIKSTPDNADITVDDKFVGTTPSTIQLSPGDHKIVVSKAHFKSWERTMAVTANSSINLNPELEKLPPT